MLTKRIIPCLDVDRGRVVKGVKFFDHVDAGDPVEQARRYQDDGADELVFYDITASHEGRQIMADLVAKVVEQIFMPLTVGGGIRTLDDATEHDVIDLVHSLRNHGRAARTVARATVAVRGLHKFMAVEELRGDDPTSDVEMPQVPRGLPKALTEEEVGRLLAAVDGAGALSRRDRAMLEVLYGAGLRISELCGLSLSDIDLRDCVMRAFGKGSKERIVPIGRMAVAALTDYFAAGGRPELEPERWKSRLRRSGRRSR